MSRNHSITCYEFDDSLWQNDDERKRFISFVPYSVQITTPLPTFLKQLIDRIGTFSPITDCSLYMRWRAKHGIAKFNFGELTNKHPSKKLGLCPYEEEMLHVYTINKYFDQLNQEFLNEEISPDNVTPAFILMTSAMRHSSYINPINNDFNQIGSDITVYRGMTLNDQQLVDYQPGYEILWRNFVSTTTSRQVADILTPHNTLFIVHLKGGWWQYAINISPVSHFPGEKEVLIMIQTIFSVKSVIINNGITEITMESIKNNVGEGKFLIEYDTKIFEKMLSLLVNHGMLDQLSFVCFKSEKAVE